MRTCYYRTGAAVVLMIACIWTSSAAAQSPVGKKTGSGTASPVVGRRAPDPKQAETDDDAPELTPKASQAIEKGLKYLLSTQNKDGSWDSDGKGTRAVGITSLGLMAFMAKAHFPGSGPYGKQLDRAKDFLLKAAKNGADGYLGSVMYEHGLATLALSEMWGMTRNPKDDEAIQKALEAAVKVILRSQNVGGGWRYQPTPDCGQDTSVTVMVFVALASARQAGIMVPNETIKKVGIYLKGAWNVQTGGFTYASHGHKGVTTACTAGGTYAAQLAGQRDAEMVSAALRWLEKQTPGIFGNAHYYYYTHYYAIQAMVQASDEQYAKWYPQIRDALISKQNSNGCWNKGARGGAGYATPMAIITLATPHRYIPIYQR